MGHLVIIYCFTRQKYMAMRRRLYDEHVPQATSVVLNTYYNYSNFILRYEKMSKKAFTVSIFRGSCDYYVETPDILVVQRCHIFKTCLRS